MTRLLVKMIDDLWTKKILKVVEEAGMITRTCIFGGALLATVKEKSQIGNFKDVSQCDVSFNEMFAHKKNWLQRLRIYDIYIQKRVFSSQLNIFPTHKCLFLTTERTGISLATIFGVCQGCILLRLPAHEK